MEDEHHTTVAGRRRGRGASAADKARAQALELLKARRKGETRPSYDVKMDAPIYDTVDEDEYNTIVAKRREEFSEFVVGDAGDGYIDDGEEEDWTKAGIPFSSDEEFDGEEGEKSKRKKKEKVEKEKKPTATANALSAAAALMGKQRISSMFTTSVFKKRNEEKGKGVSCDSVVDDVIAEFAPDDGDRERRRRPQSKNLGLGLGFGVNGTNNNNTNNKKPVASELIRKVGDDHRSLLTDLSPKNKVNDDVALEKEENLDDLSLNNEVKESEGDCVVGDEKEEEKLENVIEEVKVEPALKEEDQKVFSFNAKIKEEKVQAYNAASEWQAISDAGDRNGAGGKPVETSSISESEEKPEFVLETDGSLPFYIIDAYEELYSANAGTVYLFGKVKAGNAYHSCCVVAKNMQRCLYAIPTTSVFQNDVVSELLKDAADKKISAVEFRTKLHELQDNRERRRRLNFL